MNNFNDQHVGSSFDDFLQEEGLLEEATAVAIKRVLAWQIAEAMKAQKQRDDLMKSVTLNYSEYAKPINSLYKLPNFTDDKDED